MLKNLKKIEFLHLIALTFLIFLILIPLLHLGSHPLNLPLTYSKDSLFSLMIVKNIFDQDGFRSQNLSLGFPGGQNLLDFPMFDTWQMLKVWTLSLLSDDIFLIQNLFFYSSFFIIALAAYYVLRRLGVITWLSVLGSLLFTFLPFHLLSNTNHLFLSDYSLVPLIILCSLESATNQKVNLIPQSFSLMNKRILLTGLALIIAGSGIYYAVFSLFFIGLGLLFAWFKYQNLHLIKKSFYIMIIVLLGLIMQAAPTIRFNQQFGPNQVLSRRLPLEAELYSLRFNQLIFPLNPKWLEIFHLAKPSALVSGKLKGEGTEYLGLVGILGLATILIWPIVKNSFDLKTKMIVNRLNYFSITAILLSVSTGIGTLIAYIFTSQIRAYTRISPFIAFMCLVTFFLVVQRIGESITKNWLKKLWGVIIILLALLSLIDQISWYAPPAEQIRAAFNSDQEFVRQLEASLERDAAVFQLPYKAFPESVPIEKIDDYDLLKPYLHSQNLKFSYATIKGRNGDKWYQQASAMKTEQLISEIKAKNFSGILINRDGYSDQGRSLEASLSAALKTQPIISQDKTQIFYPLK